MDMQGTPLGSSSTGMKNTSDPERYTNPTTEGAGAVASDSLAAESARSGGKFGENRDSQPLQQSSSSSSFNNTDPSSIATTTLGPAPEAAEREAKAAWSETAEEAKGVAGQKYPEGAGGQPKFPGKHNMDGYVGGPTSAKVQTGDSGSTGQSGNSSSTGSSGGSQQMSGSDAKSAPTGNTYRGDGDSNVDAAPGYIASVVSNPGQTAKPKGKNITEGGFDEGDDKNVSFNSEIGGENDPGRAAEAGMQRMTQSSSGSTAPRQKMGESDNSQYDALDTDQSL
ncbi:hypothetical protein N7G274_009170 [Stereocaulon virgatum]|uniref:Uncharacterized protein n=1 Tax=Stereocaulon virgatum TaxID=373712 RepID=A0ABR4A1J4_9LECA